MANLNVPPCSRFSGGRIVGFGAADVMVAKGVAVGSEVSFDLAVGVGCAVCTVTVGSSCCVVLTTVGGIDGLDVWFVHCVRISPAQIRIVSEIKLLNGTKFILYSFSNR